VEYIKVKSSGSKSEEAEEDDEFVMHSEQQETRK
jgi:hypothetical protein